MPPEGEPGPGTGTGTGSEGGAQSQSQSWTTGLDAETLGYFQNRGWHDKTAAEVAVLASQAHRQAEKFIGAPADQIVRLPKATDGAEAWKPVYERLGKPADPKDYDFSVVKVGDKPLEAADVDFYRGVADKLNLSKDAAVALASELTGHAAAQAAKAAAETQAANLEGFQALQKSWGPNFESNQFVANQAAMKLGLGPDILNTLKGVVGGEKVAQALLTVGQKIGEDRFISNQNPANPGTFTREQAVAQRAELMRDTAFGARLLAGDADANKQMMALNTVITAD